MTRDEFNEKIDDYWKIEEMSKMKETLTHISHRVGIHKFLLTLH